MNSKKFGAGDSKLGPMGTKPQQFKNFPETVPKKDERSAAMSSVFAKLYGGKSHADMVDPRTGEMFDIKTTPTLEECDAALAKLHEYYDARYAEASAKRTNERVKGREAAQAAYDLIGETVKDMHPWAREAYIEEVGSWVGTGLAKALPEEVPMPMPMPMPMSNDEVDNFKGKAVPVAGYAYVTVEELEFDTLEELADSGKFIAELIRYIGSDKYKAERKQNDHDS